MASIDQKQPVQTPVNPVYHFYMDVVKDTPGREIVRIQNGEVSVLDAKQQPIALFNSGPDNEYGLFERTQSAAGSDQFKFYCDPDGDGIRDVFEIHGNERGYVGELKRSSDPSETYYEIVPHIFSDLENGKLLNAAKAGPYKKTDMSVLQQQLSEKQALLRAEGKPGMLDWGTNYVYGYDIEGDRIMRVEIRREGGLSLGYIKRIVDDKTGELIRVGDAGTDASNWPFNDVPRD